jgi:hypothetical protein
MAAAFPLVPRLRRLGSVPSSSWFGAVYSRTLLRLKVPIKTLRGRCARFTVATSTGVVTDGDQAICPTPLSASLDVR